MAVSSSEAQYIIESCLTNYRIDGRTKLEHRPYTITNQSTKNKTTATNTGRGDAPSFILSNGSSRIHLPGSTTDILCSVKADLVHPSSSKPNEGVVELGLDLSLCGGGGTVGGGGGSGSSAPKKRKQQRDEESQITSLLQRLVLPHAVNYKRLVIWPGKYVWRLSIDIVVLRCDGCILDACSIAIREALCSTKLPKVQAVMEGGNNNNDSNGGGGGGGGGGSSKNDLMVDGDFKMATSPAGAQDCPLVITVSVLSAPPTLVAASSGGGNGSSKKRHRSISIIDARTEEEACAASRVCVSVDPSGMVCGVHTLGGGGVVLLDESENSYGGGQSSSMPLAMLGDIVNSAAMASKNLYELLNGDSEREQDKKTNMKKKNVGTVDGDDGCGYGYLLKNHFHIQ